MPLVAVAVVVGLDPVAVGEVSVESPAALAALSAALPADLVAVALVVVVVGVDQERTVPTPPATPDALTAVCGYVPVPLTGRDYLELLPVRWLTIADHGPTSAAQCVERPLRADLGKWADAGAGPAGRQAPRLRTARPQGSEGLGANAPTPRS
ncbi:hypothetical protein OG535_40495 [Kitasatospora sp. NBC_00085]|uniref:hypothetical protein n=1 Tax=Kitasatospora sp. NBC_00085 TaxID=2903566 RepID=UPI0032482D7B